MTTQDDAAVREQVRARYAAAATAVTAGTAASCGGTADGCCGPAAEGLRELDDTFGAELYGAGEQSEVPAEALAASLGCGNPLAVADLQPGETVLDLGSGGGIDVLLSARRVGPSGFAYGVDMTDEMLELARANAARAGAGNAGFLRGTIEDIPLPGAAVKLFIAAGGVGVATGVADTVFESGPFPTALTALTWKS